jgi:membrane protease YdiL (CAAX protease family)
VLLALGALFLTAVVGGALLAPPVHRLLLVLGRSVEALTGLRDLTFERVLTRCVVVGLVVAAYPVFRVTRVGAAELGLRLTAKEAKRWGRGLALGAVCVGTVYAVGWAGGAYAPAEMPVWRLLVRAAGLLPAAALVGLTEEVLFRAALFGSLRELLGRWPGIVLSSLLFGLVHFLHPEPLIGVAHPHWQSGLAMLPHALRPIHGPAHYFPMGATLVMMGSVLALVYGRTGSLWLVAGLHAGVILGVRWGAVALARVPAGGGALFQPEGELPRSYAALLLTSAFVAALAWGWRRRKHSG